MNIEFKRHPIIMGSLILCIALSVLYALQETTHRLSQEVQKKKQLAQWMTQKANFFQAIKSAMRVSKHQWVQSDVFQSNRLPNGEIKLTGHHVSIDELNQFMKQLMVMVQNDAVSIERFKASRSETPNLVQVEIQLKWRELTQLYRS